MPSDRDRMADALASATPAMLREDARQALSHENMYAPLPVDTTRRLAALALAVAEMQERAEREAAPSIPDWEVGVVGATDFSYGARWAERSLPTALAAMLRGEP